MQLLPLIEHVPWIQELPASINLSMMESRVYIAFIPSLSRFIPLQCLLYLCGLIATVRGYLQHPTRSTYSMPWLRAAGQSPSSDSTHCYFGYSIAPTLTMQTVPPCTGLQICRHPVPLPSWIGEFATKPTCLNLPTAMLVYCHYNRIKKCQSFSLSFSQIGHIIGHGTNRSFNQILISR
jgi:hypothetical protein